MEILSGLTRKKMKNDNLLTFLLEKVGALLFMAPGLNFLEYNIHDNITLCSRVKVPGRS